MILKIFTQSNCPKCPAAKKLGKETEKLRNPEIKVEYYDVSTINGLAEASFYTVLSTPGLILCDNQGKEIKGWRGEVPSEKEIIKDIQ